ncbi:hypothetical protein MTO96_017788 [Rhipicephalus appendiculatus]
MRETLEASLRSRSCTRLRVVADAPRGSPRLFRYGYERDSPPEQPPLGSAEEGYDFYDYHSLMRRRLHVQPARPRRVHLVVRLRHDSSPVSHRLSRHAVGLVHRRSRDSRRSFGNITASLHQGEPLRRH